MALALFNPCNPCCQTAEPFRCCPGAIPANLCVTLANELDCECLDGLTIPMVWDGTAHWASTQTSTGCGLKRILLRFHCDSSLITRPDCSRYFLEGWCGIETPPGPPDIIRTYSSSCSCSPFEIAFTGVTLETMPDFVCCPGTFSALVTECAGTECCPGYIVPTTLHATLINESDCACLDGLTLTMKFIENLHLWQNTDDDTLPPCSPLDYLRLNFFCDNLDQTYSLTGEGGQRSMPSTLWSSTSTIVSRPIVSSCDPLYCEFSGLHFLLNGVCEGTFGLVITE